ncbi:MAG TPA: thioredoxin [Clostridiales bacterium]|nr:thioredoxin [Clostridiales bacterium]
MSDVIKHPNAQDFDQLIESNGVVLVDFWATWCGPCKMLAPVIEQLANQYDGKAAVAKVDVDEQSALAQRFGIQSIPTVIVFKNGNEVSREIGFKPAATYSGLLDSLL